MGDTTNTDAPASRDRNVDAVREKLLQRSQRGILKYGVTTERTDITHREWLQHAQEEALDFSVYIERLIQNEDHQWFENPDRPKREPPEFVWLMFEDGEVLPGRWKDGKRAFYIDWDCDHTNAGIRLDFFDGKWRPRKQGEGLTGHSKQRIANASSNENGGVGPGNNGTDSPRSV